MTGQCMRQVEMHPKWGVKNSFVNFAYIAQLINFIMSVSETLSQMRNDKSAENLKAGQDFLAANSSKPGVTELPSGLQ